MADSYFIGGKQFGLQKNVRPFWLPDQAYQFLENCFAFRERVQKKPGYSNIGRLRRVLTTVSIGNISAGGAQLLHLIFEPHSGSMSRSQILS